MANILTHPRTHPFIDKKEPEEEEEKSTADIASVSSKKKF
jgi:hypothetical protein